MASPPDTRSMAARYRLNTVAAALVLVFGSFLPLNAQPKAPEVMVANPVLKRIVQWDEYTGQFEAVRRVEVRARVSGELLKIHFTDGQTVKAGDILFTIDPRPFEIAVEAARAEVARARAQIAVTASDLDRAEQLTPSRVLTQRNFDQRKAPITIWPRHSCNPLRPRYATPTSTLNGRRCGRRSTAASPTVKSMSATSCPAA